MARLIRALRVTAHSAPLRLEEVPLRDPGPDELVVELAAAGVNPIDRYAALGMVAPDGPLPRTLGTEASGWVDGKPVLVNGGGIGWIVDGLWAEAAVVPRDQVISLDPAVDLTAAAALGIAGATAWNTVHEAARVTADDRVLVLGGAGGTGLPIISLALAAGAAVVGQSGSEPKAAVIREFGAQAIVADAASLAEELGDFSPTVIFDPLGGEFTTAALTLLAPRGRHVLFGTSSNTQATIELRPLYRAAQRILGYGGTNLTEDERRTANVAAAAAFAAGQLKIHVGRVVPLSEAAGESNTLFDLLTDRSLAGKLILDCTG